MSDSGIEKYKDIDALMADWYTRLCNAQTGHYVCSERLYRRADYTGYLLIFSSTIVTSCFFLQVEGGLKLTLFFISVLSAALSGIVSFGRFAEKAELHRSAASCYGKLRRQLENLRSKKSGLQDDDMISKLKVLRIEWEYISENSPLTPKSALVRN
ncbi:MULTISPECIES: SLATT domain-containing protein [Serratia]|uniref:SLATT domain-containing protein n=1 Tax=Serratia TaxID=613 RepID=UPI00128E79E0|nr:MULTISPECIES: SLATT domain-containing protein [Serratia]MDI3198519.1 SLATT domain-containing protein [Serratia ureilytica]